MHAPPECSVRTAAYVFVFVFFTCCSTHAARSYIGAPAQLYTKYIHTDRFTAALGERRGSTNVFPYNSCLCASPSHASSTLARGVNNGRAAQRGAVRCKAKKNKFVCFGYILRIFFRFKPSRRGAPRTNSVATQRAWKDVRVPALKKGNT